MSTRIAHAGLAAKCRSAQEAAALIKDGMTVGMSGFTGSGYPKAVPLALAERIGFSCALCPVGRPGAQAGPPFSSETPQMRGAAGGDKSPTAHH